MFLEWFWTTFLMFFQMIFINFFLKKKGFFAISAKDRDELLSKIEKGLFERLKVNKKNQKKWLN